MLINRFWIIFCLSILCFGCQNNTTIAEDQIIAEDQTFTISNGIREGSLIGKIESTNTLPVHYYLLSQGMSKAFSLDSITGEFFITDVSILQNFEDSVIELEVLFSRTGNYIEHGVLSKIIINVIKDHFIYCWDSREQQGEITDAVVNSLFPTNNFASPIFYQASAWTNKLQATITRTYMKFDLSTIPQGAKIESAKLFLFSPSDSISEHAHSTLSGTNEFYVRRVIEKWNPQTITWQNQPVYTFDNEVLLASSLTHYQDYEIDITNIVRSIIETGEVNNGFLIMLKEESFYRRICFSGSSNHDNMQQPYLQILYK